MSYSDNENFEKALNFVLSWEGGYSNDPDDSGGKTIYGISSRSYPNVVEMIENAKEGERMEIVREFYYKIFWEPLGCDSMEWPMNLIVFDTGVNMGKSFALRLCEKSNSPADYLFNRIDRYVAISKQNNKFLRGWINRVISLWKKIN